MVIKLLYSTVNATFRSRLFRELFSFHTLPQSERRNFPPLSESHRNTPPARAGSSPLERSRSDLLLAALLILLSAPCCFAQSTPAPAGAARAAAPTLAQVHRLNAQGK